jgi:imidazolonepropionase-like amidohydrolase
MQMRTVLTKQNKTAFVSVNVVTMLDNTIQENKTVLVEDGIIKSIDDPTQFKMPEDVFIVDGTNKYLMPGLIDMHVHLGDNKDDLLLFLVNGVTTIRNMWGYEHFRLINWLMGTRVFDHLALRDNINNGIVSGPTLFTAGPMIEGEDPFFPRYMVQRVKSTRCAEDIVQKQADQGYDLIKFYSTVSKEVFHALVSTAKKKRISIAGHVPDKVDLKNAINANVTSLEHLLGFFNPYNPDLAVKENEIHELVQLSAENTVYHCPTLIASERICNSEAQEKYEGEPEMQYVPKRVKRGMRFLLKSSADLFRKKGLKPNHEYLPFLFRIVQEFKRQGAPLLLGTDKGTPYVVAGFSVHRELQLLHDAGLTPFEALEAGTINAAKCLHKEAVIGTIGVGKRADLLLVEENPLIDLETIKTHCGIMVKGEWLSRDKCNEFLAELKEKNK